MNKTKDFDIHILKLSENKHEFNFEIDDSFFQMFENSLLDKGSLKSKVVVDKNAARLEFNFHIEGNVALICDRSLDSFNKSIKADHTIIFKFSDKHAELSEDVYQIPHGEQKINVAQFIYEFISLEIPMRKLHPRYDLDEMDADEEGEIIYTSEKEDSDKESNDIDPRWKELNKLIDKDGTS